MSALPPTPLPALHEANSDVTLLDLLDRVLDKGVVLSGSLTLAVADIDLVHVSLRALVAAVHRIVDLTHTGTAAAPAVDPTIASGVPEPSSQVDDPEKDLPHREHLGPVVPERINTEPHGVEKGLAKLVLTLVELLRQLMERQAIRRMEGGSLTDEEVERLGRAFMKLQQRMTELKKTFGFEQDELNLHLGPLGKLL